MKKKILIITPFFAPETHAAVFRAHKLAKYLNRENWEVHVLTVDTNYVYNEDENLLKELEGVTIHRAKYIEPTLRGLRMWLTGKDRTFKTLKKKGFYADKGAAPNDMAQENSSPNWKSRVYSYILERYLNNPDRFWTWEKNAVKLGLELIKEHNLGTIYSTCNPFTSNKIGLKLKQKTGVKWIADFRDPQLTVKRNHSKIRKVKIQQSTIVRNTFELSDYVVTASFAHTLMINDLFQEKFKYKIKFIPTGADDDYIQNANSVNINNDPYFVFVGEYLKEYSNYFFEVFKSLLLKYPDLRIKIIGNRLINLKLLEPVIQNLDIQNNIDFIDHLPQNELYGYIKNAAAAILVPNALWWCSFAKMVDYIALRVRVIALVPELSEAKLQLTKSGLGVFLTKILEKDLNLIENSILINKESSGIDYEFCDNYLATSQVKSFIKLFKNA